MSNVLRLFIIYIFSFQLVFAELWVQKKYEHKTVSTVNKAIDNFIDDTVKVLNKYVIEDSVPEDFKGSDLQASLKPHTNQIKSALAKTKFKRVGNEIHFDIKKQKMNIGFQKIHQDILIINGKHLDIKKAKKYSYLKNWLESELKITSYEKSLFDMILPKAYAGMAIIALCAIAIVGLIFNQMFGDKTSLKDKINNLDTAMYRANEKCEEEKRHARDEAERWTDYEYETVKFMTYLKSEIDSDISGLDFQEFSCETVKKKMGFVRVGIKSMFDHLCYNAKKLDGCKKDLEKIIEQRKISVDSDRSLDLEKNPSGTYEVLVKEVQAIIN